MVAASREKARRRALCALVVVAAIAGLFSSTEVAAAAPRTPKFGPAIDNYPEYQGARRCDPSAKPGVLAFRSIVLRAYPGTGAGGIGRACSTGGTSEHHEGRAWDWMVSASNASDRTAATQVINWLLAKDRYGNEAAMARRLGIMYIIWNRRIWLPYSGWRTYCVQRKGACVDPDDKSARSPHTDHVHFSFTWPGAKKQTSYWHPSMTMIAAIDQRPGGGGFWMLGRNGSVVPGAGVGDYGSKSGAYNGKKYVAMAATPTGAGYWVASSDGRVIPFGDARRRGDVRQRNMGIAGIAATPSGRGYWIAGRGGQVLPFGDARRYGDLRGGSSRIVAIESSPSGKGYWLVTRSGRVVSFGDAPVLDGPERDAEIVGMARAPSGSGFWLAARDGRVFSYGDAANIDGRKAPSPVVGIAATSSGRGLWLVTASGKTLALGDAG